ncbi:MULTISPECIES: TraX family protein [Pseudomonas syringae group]|nr:MULTISPECIES: TraX family protein [Pseudomonas syringae group]MCF4986948.1 conjugal transfer protein TraX [Pseudomonas syringae]MCF5031031.1 conjugal transfer protein TraX [Pseudomonas syringae]MCF5203394.1 conjugal transfer protein TraX [Pseudomonas syringae]MCF5271575.1 conjugal transfer protein TraX [Pseudomonas syringae]MCF5275296.1 conjugal transfer protein TraX [Pseudomonas syringae]
MAEQHFSKKLPTSQREGGLDLVKWLALVTMVIDHLRMVLPNLTDLFIPGRLSFPLFCLVIGANVARSTKGEFATKANGRYLGLMLAFSAISEVPYRYFEIAQTFNVMPTLTLGLVIAWGVHHRCLSSGFLAIVGLAAAILLHTPLMYGFWGCLIPAATLIAIQKKAGLFWLLPAVLCVVVNTRGTAWTRAMNMEVSSIMALLVALAAPLIGLWLLRRKTTTKLWPVTAWSYWFYPLHIVALQGLGHLYPNA